MSDKDRGFPGFIDVLGQVPGWLGLLLKILPQLVRRRLIVRMHILPGGSAPCVYLTIWNGRTGWIRLRRLRLEYPKGKVEEPRTRGVRFDGPVDFATEHELKVIVKSQEYEQLSMDLHAEEPATVAGLSLTMEIDRPGKESKIIVCRKRAGIPRDIRAA